MDRSQEMVEEMINFLLAPSIILTIRILKQRIQLLYKL